MSKTTFQINNKLQDCEVQIENIFAKGGPLAPSLCIPLSIKLHKIDYNQFPQKFVLSFLEAKLKFQNSDVFVSTIVKPLSMDAERFSGQTLQLEFHLNENVIQAIEKYRTTDIIVTVAFVFHFGVYFKVPLSHLLPNKQMFEGDVLKDTGITSCELNLVIPHSQWLAKVLPGLGYQVCKLIELPLSSDLLYDVFPGSVLELESSISYFKNGDYDKAIAHCRVALEPIKKRILEIKTAVKSDSEFDWIKKSVDSTLTCLEVITKETYSLTSKTHHPPSIGHFNRKTTESIILMTTSLISFVSQLEISK
jgi:hypothetical protein